MNINELEIKVANLKAVFAASKKPEDKVAAIEAVRELAAAKKAAEVVVDTTELAKKAAAAQVARESAQKDNTEYKKAVRAFYDAQEWPRCGQNWPTGKKEEAYQALLDANGFEPEI